MAKITEKSVEQKINDFRSKLDIDASDLVGPSDGPVDDVMKIVIPMMKDMLEIIRALNAEVQWNSTKE